MYYTTVLVLFMHDPTSVFIRHRYILFLYCASLLSSRQLKRNQQQAVVN